MRIESTGLSHDTFSSVRTSCAYIICVCATGAAWLLGALPLQLLRSGSLLFGGAAACLSVFHLHWLNDRMGGRAQEALPH